MMLINENNRKLSHEMQNGNIRRQINYKTIYAINIQIIICVVL